MKASMLLGLLLTIGLPALAQDSTGEGARVFVKAIEDNSFLIEEAYNQEAGVVQHISTLMHFKNPSSDLLYTFTQEWPLFGQAHQLSVTIPYSWLNSNAISGIGDVLLNYRYQLFYGDDWAAVAPRLSVILPIGNPTKGLGNDVFGLQFNLPVSKRLDDHLVIHANMGATLLPGQLHLGVVQKKGTLTSYNFGMSIIYLATPAFNLMLEGTHNLLGEFDAAAEVVHPSETTLSPGLRGAIDIGELQIVPGLAIPVSFTGGTQRVGVFIYLSFEHPF